MNKKNIIFYLIMVATLFNVGCENPESGDEFPPTSITYSEIYSVNSDGTDLRQRTDGKNFIHYADFIPNSNKIFFVQTGINFNGSNQINGEQVICTMDLATDAIDTIVQANIYNGVTYVNESRDDQPRSIVISQDGKKLYYAGRLPDMWSDRKGIYCVDLQTKQISSVITAENGLRVEHFKLSFDETKLVFTEYDANTKTSFLYIMDLNGNNKKLLGSSVSSEYCFPQLLSDNKEVVYIERNGENILKVIDIDSLTTKSVTTLDPVINFFTELTTDNNIIINLSDDNPSPVLFNVFTKEQRNLEIPSISNPFFNKLRNNILYFESKWVMKKESISATQKTTIFSFTSKSGSTHVPQSSYTDDKIIFINKNTFTIKFGEIK
jgi:hypothetical protein